jgi:hypothetical protein
LLAGEVNDYVLVTGKFVKTPTQGKINRLVKGSLTRDFRLQVFSVTIFPLVPDPEYPIRAH